LFQDLSLQHMSGSKQPLHVAMTWKGARPGTRVEAELRGHTPSTANTELIELNERDECIDKRANKMNMHNSKLELYKQTMSNDEVSKVSDYYRSNVVVCASNSSLSEYFNTALMFGHTSITGTGAGGAPLANSNTITTGGGGGMSTANAFGMGSVLGSAANMNIDAMTGTVSSMPGGITTNHMIPGYLESATLNPNVGIDQQFNAQGVFSMEQAKVMEQLKAEQQVQIAKQNQMLHQQQQLAQFAVLQKQLQQQELLKQQQQQLLAQQQQQNQNQLNSQQQNFELFKQFQAYQQAQQQQLVSANKSSSYNTPSGLHHTVDAGITTQTSKPAVSNTAAAAVNNTTTSSGGESVSPPPASENATGDDTMATEPAPTVKSTISNMFKKRTPTTQEANVVLDKVTSQQAMINEQAEIIAKLKESQAQSKDQFETVVVEFMKQILGPGRVNKKVEEDIYNASASGDNEFVKNSLKDMVIAASDEFKSSFVRNTQQQQQQPSLSPAEIQALVQQQVAQQIPAEPQLSDDQRNRLNLLDQVMPPSSSSSSSSRKSHSSSSSSSSAYGGGNRTVSASGNQFNSVSSGVKRSSSSVQQANKLLSSDAGWVDRVDTTALNPFMANVFNKFQNESVPRGLKAENIMSSEALRRARNPELAFAPGSDFSYISKLQNL